MKRVQIFCLALVLFYSVNCFAAFHSINGTSIGDTINLYIRSSSIVGYVNGTNVLNLPTSSACNGNTFIFIYGLAGHDDISVNLPVSCPIRCYVYGHAGNDELSVVGCDSDAEVYGGDGDDILNLGTSSHYFHGYASGDNHHDDLNYYLYQGVLRGGSGNDHFSGKVSSGGDIFGDAGYDQFYGGSVCSEGQGTYNGGTERDYWGTGCYETIYCDPSDLELDDDTDGFGVFYFSRFGCTHIGHPIP